MKKRNKRNRIKEFIKNCVAGAVIGLMFDGLFFFVLANLDKLTTIYK